MKPSTALFDLIKSLSRNEKRYFKLHASMQKGAKNYLKLFEAIDSLKTYDETILKEKFGKENFIRNLTFNKNYLTRLIFRSLNFYSNEDSIESRLSNTLKRCKILFEKALIREYFKSVQAGKQLALNNEMFGFALEFLEMERQLTPKEKIGKVDFNKVYDDEIEVMNKMLNISLFQRTVSIMLAIQRREGVVRSRQSEVEVKKILSMARAERKKNIKSVTALERYYYAYFVGEAVMGNLRKSFDFNFKRYELIKSHGNIFEKYIYDNKRTSLLSLIESAYTAGKFKTARTLFEKYEKEYKTKKNFELRSQIVSCDLVLTDALQNGYSLSREDTGAIEKLLNKYKGKINIVMYNMLFYKLSSYYFFKEQFTESLRIINLLFQSRLLRHTASIEPYARILNLLIHYELKNFKLLSHLISSTIKYLKIKSRFLNTEKNIISFLKDSISRNDEIPERFIELKKKIKYLSKSKYEKNAFHYFDYLKWIDKKII